MKYQMLDREREINDARHPNPTAWLGLCLPKTHAGCCESDVGAGRIAIENRGSSRQDHPALVEKLRSANGEDRN
jgi:hypothetical protein